MACLWCSDEEFRGFAYQVFESLCEESVGDDSQDELWDQLVPDLCYCLQCVQVYHEIKEKFLRRKRSKIYEKKLYKLEIRRLLDHLSKIIEQCPHKGLDKPINNDREGTDCQTTSPCEAPELLYVPLLEILGYPYLLFHEDLFDLFIRGLLLCLSHGELEYLEDHYPGCFYLLFSPNQKVFEWAIKNTKDAAESWAHMLDIYSPVITSILNAALQDRLSEKKNERTLVPISMITVDTVLAQHMFPSKSQEQYLARVQMIWDCLDKNCLRDLLLYGVNSQFIEYLIRTLSQGQGNKNTFWSALGILQSGMLKLGSTFWIIAGSRVAPKDVINAITSSPLFVERVNAMKKETFDENTFNDGTVGNSGCSSILYTMKFNLDPTCYHNVKPDTTCLLSWCYPFIFSVLDLDMAKDVLHTLLCYIKDCFGPIETMSKMSLLQAHSFSALGSVFSYIMDMDAFHTIDEGSKTWLASFVSMIQRCTIITASASILSRGVLTTLSRNAQQIILAVFTKELEAKLVTNTNYEQKKVVMETFFKKHNVEDTTEVLNLIMKSLQNLMENAKNNKAPESCARVLFSDVERFQRKEIYKRSPVLSPVVVVEDVMRSPDLKTAVFAKGIKVPALAGDSKKDAIVIDDSDSETDPNFDGVKKLDVDQQPHLLGKPKSGYEDISDVDDISPMKTMLPDGESTLCEGKEKTIASIALKNVFAPLRSFDRLDSENSEGHSIFVDVSPVREDLDIGERPLDNEPDDVMNPEDNDSVTEMQRRCKKREISFVDSSDEEESVKLPLKRRKMRYSCIESDTNDADSDDIDSDDFDMDIDNKIDTPLEDNTVVKVDNNDNDIKSMFENVSDSSGDDILATCSYDTNIESTKQHQLAQDTSYQVDKNEAPCPPILTISSDDAKQDDTEDMHIASTDVGKSDDLSPVKGRHDSFTGKSIFDLFSTLGGTNVNISSTSSQSDNDETKTESPVPSNAKTPIKSIISEVENDPVKGDTTNTPSSDSTDAQSAPSGSDSDPLRITTKALSSLQRVLASMAGQDRNLSGPMRSALVELEKENLPSDKNQETTRSDMDKKIDTEEGAMEMNIDHIRKGKQEDLEPKAVLTKDERGNVHMQASIESVSDHKELPLIRTNKAGGHKETSKATASKVAFKTKTNRSTIPDRVSNMTNQELSTKRVPVHTVQPTLTLPELATQQEYHVDLFMCEILKWQTRWMKDGPDEDIHISLPMAPRQVKNSYQSFDQYMKTQLPLLLMDTFAGIAKEWNERKTDPRNSFDANLTSLQCPTGSCKYFIYRCTVVDDTACQIPLQNDLVMLAISEAAGGNISEIFAIVETVEKESIPDLLLQNEGLLNGNSLKMHTLTMRAMTPVSISHGIVPIRGVTITSLSSAVRKWQGLLKLPRSILAPDILRPFRGHVFELKANDVRERKHLNPSQAKAVQAVRSAVRCNYANPRICLLQGPPGTGKTHTLKEIIKGILLDAHEASKDKGTRPRILVCAPSNAAVDEISRRLFADPPLIKHKDEQSVSREEKRIRYNNCGDFNLVRIGREAKMHQQTKRHSFQFFVQKELAKRSYMYLPHQADQSLKKLTDELKALDKVCSQLKMSSEPEKRAELNEKMKERVDKQRKYEQLMRDTRKKQTRKEVETQIKRDVLAYANIISCTLSYAGSKDMITNIKRAQILFSCVIIDEAGQCCEPEALIPLQYGATKLVLVGDHAQLPATVMSRRALSYGYGMSLFERIFASLLETCRIRYPLMLDTQFRMHEGICAFPSKMFYENRVKTASVTKARKQPPSIRPYVILDIKEGKEMYDGRSALHNPMERKYAAYLCEQIKRMNTFKYEDIGIISPYRKQVNMLRVDLESRQINGIEVDSIDGFQGREKNCIILSCVRAREHNESVGFLQNPQRLNVALTRARRCLIILLHANSLKIDEEWCALLDDARERNLLYSIKTEEEAFRAVFTQTTPQVLTQATATPTSYASVVPVSTSNAQLINVSQSIAMDTSDSRNVQSLASSRIATSVTGLTTMTTIGDPRLMKRSETPAHEQISTNPVSEVNDYIENRVAKSIFDRSAHSEESSIGKENHGASSSTTSTRSAPIVARRRQLINDRLNDVVRKVEGRLSARRQTQLVPFSKTGWPAFGGSRRRKSRADAYE